MTEKSLIEKVLINGPIMKKGSKHLIKATYNLPKQNRIRAIKEIYGTGSYGGKHTETVFYDNEGLKIKKDGMEAALTWPQVEKRIAELIAQGKY